MATKQPHPLPPPVAKAADRPAHCTVKTNVYLNITPIIVTLNLHCASLFRRILCKIEMISKIELS